VSAASLIRATAEDTEQGLEPTIQSGCDRQRQRNGQHHHQDELRDEGQPRNPQFEFVPPTSNTIHAVSLSFTAPGTDRTDF
jgi:hypothetical protein